MTVGDGIDAVRSDAPPLDWSVGPATTSARCETASVSRAARRRRRGSSASAARGVGVAFFGGSAVFRSDRFGVDRVLGGSSSASAAGARIVSLGSAGFVVGSSASVGSAASCRWWRMPRGTGRSRRGSRRDSSRGRSLTGLESPDADVPARAGGVVGPREPAAPPAHDGDADSQSDGQAADPTHQCLTGHAVCIAPKVDRRAENATKSAVVRRRCQYR